jgi:hypothetical protein
MINAKCSVSDIITDLCLSEVCRHLSLTTTPASTSGETSFASQVLPKGSIVRVLLVHCCSIEPSVCPCANKITSIAPAQGGDGGEPGNTKVEQNKGEVTLPREEEDPSKKRKVSPPKPLSRKRAKATKAKLEIVLTPDDFDFIIAALNDTSLEIAEKKEAKQEEVFSRIRDKLQGVQQAIQSSRAVSTILLPSRTPE